MTVTQKRGEKVIEVRGEQINDDGRKDRERGEEGRMIGKKTLQHPAAWANKTKVPLVAYVPSGIFMYLNSVNVCIYIHVYIYTQ